MSARSPVIRDDPEVTDGTIDAFQATRRDLVGRGLAAGGATVLAATIPTLLRVREAFAAVRGDPEVLAQALALEQVALFAYDSVLAKRALSPAATRVVRTFRAHEQAHVQALTVDLRNINGIAPRPPARETDVDKALERFQLRRSLSMLRTQAETISFLIDLEAVSTGAYYDAIARLRDFRLLQLAAQIMANESQHAAVLRTLARPREITRSVPSAFERGRR